MREYRGNREKRCKGGSKGVEGIVCQAIMRETEGDLRCHIAKYRVRKVCDTNPRSIRFAPPLVISEEDVRKAVRIIGESLEELDTVSWFCRLDLGW